MKKKRWQQVLFWLLLPFILYFVVVTFRKEHVILATSVNIKPSKPFSPPTHPQIKESLSTKNIETPTDNKIINNKIMSDIESMVANEQSKYDKIFNKYKKAITEYEILSSDFDEALGEHAEMQRLTQELYEQAREVLQLEKSAFDAYKDLMVKYDEAVPAILAKYF